MAPASHVPHDVGMVKIRPRTELDDQWIADRFVEEWGATFVVSRGRRLDAEQLPALIAEVGDQKCGLATYHTAAGETELVSLNAFVPQQGVGTALLAATIEEARAAGSRRLWLITTNDNLDALRFYQRRGLRLVAVHPGAVDESRKLKPEIPLTGDYGIRVHDEIEVEFTFGPVA
jgi:ribosomal protein S18 acetylase RimI-like enzyme